jgi:hypothetical protein
LINRKENLFGEGSNPKKFENIIYESYYSVLCKFNCKINISLFFSKSGETLKTLEQKLWQLVLICYKIFFKILSLRSKETRGTVLHFFEFVITSLYSSLTSFDIPIQWQQKESDDEGSEMKKRAFASLVRNF